MTEEKALTKREPTPAVPVLSEDVVALGRALKQSGYFQDVQSEAQAIVKILAGRELGFPAVASLVGIYIVKGRITLSANLMSAAIKRTGRYDFRVLALTDQECVISFLNGGQVVGESRFTLADATKAGLALGENWKKYPRNMLYARALTNGAKWFCPDVLLGQPFPVSAGMPGEPVEDDAPIIEGRPVNVTTGEVKVVTEPPEGNKPNWNGFWADAREMHLNRTAVHRALGVEDKNGALLDYAKQRAAQEGKPLPQVVTELRAMLRQMDPEGLGAEGPEEDAVPALFASDPTWDAPPPDFSDPRGDPTVISEEERRL